MSTLSELQKKLQQESQGIMFPFSAATSAVNTTQQVYDSSTDGIMTMTGKKYTGPNAVVQYGTEAQGYPRQLKQIEAPMLPQVSNLPPQGTGIVENAPGTTVPDPITETPVEQPTVNPCPSGYQLVNGVCQQVAQQKPDEPREKFIPTYDTAPGFSNKERLNFYSNLYENGGVDSNNYYGLNNLITKDGNSLSFNFSNLEDLKEKNKYLKRTPIGYISNLVKVNGSSVNMKGQMKFFLENNLATSNIDMKLLDPISLNKRPEDTTLILNENGQSFIENIDNVNNALYNKDDFGNIKGKGLFNFLGTKYGSGGIGLSSKDMNSLVVDLAAQYNSASAQYLLNTKNPELGFNKGGSFYHLNKLGYAKQYDITKFSKAVQEQYNEEKATDEAQEQGFKDTQEQLEYREKAAKEANKRAEGKRASQSQFKGGKDYKGGATATGTTSCFHPDTDVNGKKIKDIKAGDYINDSLVEGMVQFKMNNPYYLIDNIKVSGSHGVLHNNKWIFVADHPESKEVKDITEFVYVPIVKGGTFKINNTTYADYDYHDIVVLGDDEWKKRRGFK